MHSNPNRSAALPAHEQRVLDESAELHERITRLVAFVGESPIYQTLAQPDQFLLRQQLGVMQEYHRILKERILRVLR